MQLWWFHNKRSMSLLLSGLTIFLLSIIIKSSNIAPNLPSKLQDGITLALSVLYEAIPFVVLGVLLSTLVQLFVKREWLFAHLPKNGILRRFLLSALGFFLPVCECGNVPLSRGMMIQGLSPADTMTFLFSAPIVNPITILTTVQAFGGWELALPRLLFALFISNIIGWVYSGRKQDDLLTKDFLATCNVKQKRSSKTRKQIFDKGTVFFTHELTALIPALIAGSIVAGIIQTTIPQSILNSIGTNPVLSIIALIVLAGIVSICATVDAFFALSLSSNFSSGSLLSFLVFGPMIDIKMLSLLRTTYKKKVLIELTLLIALMSFVAGLVVDYVV